MATTLKVGQKLGFLKGGTFARQNRLRGSRTHNPRVYDQLLSRKLFPPLRHNTFVRLRHALSWLTASCYQISPRQLCRLGLLGFHLSLINLSINNKCLRVLLSPFRPYKPRFNLNRCYSLLHTRLNQDEDSGLSIFAKVDSLRRQWLGLLDRHALV